MGPKAEVYLRVRTAEERSGSGDYARIDADGEAHIETPKLHRVSNALYSNRIAQVAFFDEITLRLGSQSHVEEETAVRLDRSYEQPLDRG